MIGKKIESLSLKTQSSESSTKKKPSVKVKVNSEMYSNIKDSKLFRVRYSVDVDIESRLKIYLTYDFDFQSEEDFSEEVAKSKEVRTLVPSMSYPYIKSYAEYLISMSGLGNFNLPYFDFFSAPLEPEDEE
ncbi:hypothetical protein ACFFX4_004669 [Citrobacter farmeri]